MPRSRTNPAAGCLRPAGHRIEQLWHYTTLAALYRDRLPGLLSTELASTVAAIQIEAG